MKTSLLRGHFLAASLLVAAACPALAAPVQYNFNFTFSGLESSRNNVGEAGRAAPKDPVSGNVRLTLDLAGADKFGNTTGLVDSMTLDPTTRAFSTTNVRYYLQRGFSYDIGDYYYYLTFGRIVPTLPGVIGPDDIFHVTWGTDDFTLGINNMGYLNAGGMLVYSDAGTDPTDAWITRNAVFTVGRDAPPQQQVPEPASLALACLGLLGVRAWRRRRD